MHKLYAVNWALAKQLLLDEVYSMDRIVHEFGLVIYVVLVLKKLLETVHTQDGDILLIVLMELV